jgi:hypothetical protein
LLAPLVEDDPLTQPTVSIVTTSLGHRLPYLRRLIAQAPWIHDFQWVICGPNELAPFAREHCALFIPSYDKIGTCRNLCADSAAGEIIVQMDDDDWQHPYRIEKQVNALLGRHDTHGSVGPEVVGSSWLYWLHGPTQTANRLSYWGSLHCLPGASLAYWRSSWKRHPFVPGMAEDGPFTSYFGSQGTCFDMHDPKLLVYMRHDDHAPEQRDWWQETKSADRRLSALERMRRRIEHPNRRIPLVEDETPRDVAIAHEQEVSAVYVRHLMGDRAFEEFCRPVSDLVGEVLDDETHALEQTPDR